MITIFTSTENGLNSFYTKPFSGRLLIDKKECLNWPMIVYLWPKLGCSNGHTSFSPVDIHFSKMNENYRSLLYASIFRLLFCVIMVVAIIRHATNTFTARVFFLPQYNSYSRSCLAVICLVQSPNLSSCAGNVSFVQHAGLNLRSKCKHLQHSVGRRIELMDSLRSSVAKYVNSGFPQ